MLEDIIDGKKRALVALKRIKRLPTEKLTEEYVFNGLREAINGKLMIHETKEENLRNLVIISIKRQQNNEMGTISDDVLSHKIQKYDCHQTSLVAQKKVLLQMFLEKELGICLSDEETEEIDNLKNMAKIYTRHLKA